MLERDSYYLSQNVVYLRTSITNIEEKLENIVINSNFCIVGSDSGFPILTENGEFLNLSDNPKNEIISIFNSVPQSENNLYIICGLELAHLLNYFAHNSKGQIILYESDFEIIKYTLSKVSLIKTLAKINVHFVTNSSELQKCVTDIKSTNHIEKTFILANNYYSKKYNKAIKEFSAKYCN